MCNISIQIRLNQLTFEMLTNCLPIAENPEDIYPYATFCLPENQQVAPHQHHQQNVNTMGTMGTYREMPGTVGHMDMLILHQNQTLPLSDANSKSVRVMNDVVYT